MRLAAALAAVALLAAASTPALAGNMRQSPLMGHKAGEACAPGHRRTMGSSTYRMGGCISGRR